MSAEYNFYAAVVVGLMGATHCFGMCGGIVGAFSQALKPDLTLQQRLAFVFSYNLGRILSYVVAGAFVASMASGLMMLFQFDLLLLALQILAAMMLIAMGLYIGQWLPWLTHLEKMAMPLWRCTEPLRASLLPISSKKKAVAAGMVWGWIPCGLVYSTLTWALASASPLNGALIMLGFGLGTLPALFAMGAAAEKLMLLIRNKKAKWLSALVLIVYGTQMTYIALKQLF